MPEPFDLERLKLVNATPYRELLGRCAGASLRRYADDETLITEGDESGEVFLVLQGACVVETASDAGLRPQSLAIIQAEPAAPAFVGEMAALGSGYRSAAVRCSGAVFAIALPPDDLDTLINEFPFFTRCLCRQFADRLREANLLIKECHNQTALDAQLLTRQPGDLIFKMGDSANTLFQLVEGAVRIKNGTAEKTATAAQLPEGFIEPRPYFLEGHHQATVIADTAVMLVAISNRSVKAVARRYPGLLLDLFRSRKA